MLGIPVNSSTPETDLNTLILGYLSKSVAGAADVSLSEAEARNAVHEYTGALTGNISVIMPDDAAVAQTKIYLVHNNTSGAFTLTVKTVSGTGVVVTQGTKAILVCDGTNIVQWTAFL